MRALIVGAGAVGRAIAAIAARRPFLELLVVADVDPLRARGVAAGAAEGGLRCIGEPLDASDRGAAAALLRRHRIDVLVNACDPRCNPPLFGAAEDAGCVYLDMALNLSQPHPEQPHRLVGVPLGAGQLDAHERWAARGALAIVGIGVEPGLSDVFARYAHDRLFSRIDEIGVRDGADLTVDGYAFAPTFSIWTTIEECLNPPVVYERGRGWFTTEPFSEPELFHFPGGIGAVECVNVEHEEVLLIPRHLPDVGRVTFKYGLGAEFIAVLKVLHLLGLDAKGRVRVGGVGGVEVSPRDVVAATLPDPATLGDRMHGKTCAGTVVRGLDKSGRPSELYLHHLVDNAVTMRDYGCQAVAWQTAVNPVIAMELLAHGVWHGAGVLGPEALPAEPFLELLDEYGCPAAVDDLSLAPQQRVTAPLRVLQPAA